MIRSIVDVAIPYKSGKYSYGDFIYNRKGILGAESQSLINQGNILTFVRMRPKFVPWSCVAIPYKSGKYSYSIYWRVRLINDLTSQSLINQGNILTLPFVSC